MRGLFDPNGEEFAYLRGTTLYTLEDEPTGRLEGEFIVDLEGNRVWRVEGDGVYSLDGTKSIGFFGSEKPDNL
jgi:hypothetical protein